MWSSWVRRNDTTQVMYIAKLKDGPKRVTKTFSMKSFSKRLTFEGSSNSRHIGSHYNRLILKHGIAHMIRQTPILLYGMYAQIKRELNE